MKIMVVLACLFSLFGCKPGSRVSADDSIVKFSYSRDGGMRYDDGYGYSVKRTDDGKAHFLFDKHLPNEKEFTIDDLSVFDSLQKIILKHRMYRYSGFYKRRVKIHDGKTWYFSVEYASGKTIDAHGYMHGPRGYGEAFDEVKACLDKWKNLPKGDTMIYFSLYRGGGMRQFDGYRYQIEATKDGRVHFLFNERYPDEKEYYTDDHSVFDSLDKIVRKYDMANYASNYEPEVQVFDGQSWDLYVRYASKASIRSGGYMAGPDNWRQAENEIIECLQPWKEMQVEFNGLASFDYTYMTTRVHIEPQGDHALVTIDDDTTGRHEVIEKPAQMLEELRVTTISQDLRDNGSLHSDDPDSKPFKFDILFSNGDHYVYESYDRGYTCHKTEVMLWFLERWEININFNFNK